MNVMTVHKHHKHHVLVVGGGFGGIKAALELSKNARVAVTLLSDRTDFCYYPALYHTATGGLRTETSIPLHEILPTDRVTLAQGSARQIHREHRTVTTKEGHVIPYDTLILALGSVTNYFGINGLQEYSYGIKSRSEVERLKAHLHTQLMDDRKPDLNYVVVGAGPTGIELAGALPTYLQRVMRNHGITRRAIHVDLVEAAPRLLPHSPKTTSEAVRQQLRRLGINLYLGKSVQGENADALMVNGKPLRSHTVIWTAGMATNPFFAQNNFSLSSRHKVVVDRHLETDQNVYVIGDSAETPYSGMAQTALYDARFVSKNILRRLAGKRPKAYRPKQPIYVITAGDKWAAVDWGVWHFHGILGWLLRQAADLNAFHEFERWWPAAEQWSTAFGHEESCPICTSIEKPV